MKLSRPTASTSLLASLLVAVTATPAQAFFVDGDGHYALRGETRTAEGFQRDAGSYQAIEQSFRLKGEARFNDQSSLFLEFGIFDNPREAYLGDKAKPDDPIPCEAPTDKEDDGSLPCHHQDTGEPRYEPYTPRINKAFVRYTFDYCILEAGRRPRDWGLGILLDSGSKPFDTDASVFDGVSCSVNLQKVQTLGFSVGYDKLAETGSYVIRTDTDDLDRNFGAKDSGDDIDQFYFTIEYDDRKANAGASFTKQVGIYFAQVNGRKIDNEGNEGGSNTDLKFLDLYTGFYFTDLAIRNEVLFRMGKSADPNWQSLGGKSLEGSDAATNKLNSIGLAGSIDWTLSRSGAAIGPVEYNQGDATRHVLFFNYALAPGDKDGYKDNELASADAKISRADRDSNVTAMAFHRNFKPALLLFNGRPDTDSMNVDGAFNASRVENATVLSTGYRYESMAVGNFEVKLITASLSQTVPQDLKNYYDARDPKSDDGDRPPGYFGSQLGYELDLSYSYKLGREADLGLAAAFAAPGNAWKTNEDESPVNNFAVQSSVAFHF